MCIRDSVDETHGGHDAGQSFGTRKRLDRGGQVGVRRGIAGDDAAGERDYASHPDAVEAPAETLRRHGGLEAHDAPAGARDTRHLGESTRYIGHIPHAPADGDGGELDVGEGQVEQVAGDELERRGPAAKRPRRGFLPRQGDHLRGEVEASDLAARAAVDEAEREVARAAAGVESAVTRRERRLAAVSYTHLR